MTRTGKRLRSFSQLFKPAYCLFSSDIIIGADGTVSLIRLLDKVETASLPVVLAGFQLFAEFIRNEDFSLDEVSAAAPVFGIRMTNPIGEETNFGDWPPPDVSAIKGQPWQRHRIALNLSGRLGLSHEGVYTFAVVGKIGDSDFETLTTIDLPVKIQQPPTEKVSPKKVAHRPKQATRKK
jgi:hypothetical protein